VNPQPPGCALSLETSTTSTPIAIKIQFNNQQRQE
jgi:hypothetical protein